ncbi:hypothetical protein F3N42_09035 [Marinihelvus fidelis]|uniref:Aerotolerance regulator N-terminal domain-containing protein n=1 Tax=Marinihelvus fidelis TaxID=2613842 RepID=A0A5N0T937_9GAMM|nr:BatA domain-containing protein [Marinihelvus fidelis]KAA9131452.1 hypothetical protein F3N42_09035 [Marinihelvus fidelis]
MGPLANAMLLYPAGLWALAAAAIPIIIHLVNRSRGKRVLIGNIALVRAARRRRAREIRMDQWLLLLLRLAILAVAALVIARWALPGLQDQPRDSEYITPAAWAALDGQAPSAGADVDRRLLLPGFPSVDEPVDAALAANPPDAWPLLAERLDTLRHTGAVTVTSTASAGEFGDRMPALAGPVGWVVAEGYKPSPSVPAPTLIIPADELDNAQLAQTEQALALLRRHRLPGLQWQLDSNDAPDDARPLDVSAITFPRQDSDPGFPNRLLDAILTPAEQAGLFAHAGVDLSGFPGQANDALVTDDDAGRPYRPLQPWLALLLVCLWGLERVLSERRRHE